MQILKNLYQVGGDLNGITYDEPGAMWNDANTYALQIRGEVILFDCGCGDTMDQIFQNMKYWDLDPEKIRYCIFTHPHYDHAGGASLLKSRGVQLISLPETAEAMAAGDDRCCGYLYHKKFVPTDVDEIIQSGQSIQLLGLEIEALHLPGHSMGCTAYFFYWEGRYVVVSGDVIGTLLSGNYGWSGSIDFDKVKYIQSLKKFSKIDTDLMLPGHGMVYFHRPRRRVEEVLNSALMEWR